jgi:hypothetical protein
MEPRNRSVGQQRFYTPGEIFETRYRRLQAWIYADFSTFNSSEIPIAAIISEQLSSEKSRKR